MDLKLGIYFNKNGRPIMHRSLLKVLFNPILRMFGIQISTKIYDKEIGRINISRCKIMFPPLWKIDFSDDDYDKVIKKRLLI